MYIKDHHRCTQSHVNGSIQYPAINCWQAIRLVPGSQRDDNLDLLEELWNMWKKSDGTHQLETCVLLVAYYCRPVFISILTISINKMIYPWSWWWRSHWWWGEMGAQWLEWVGLELRVRVDVSQSRGPGFETHLAAFECWASSFTTRCIKSLGMLRTSMSEKDRSRRHCNVKAFPRWRFVNNSSSATIHHVALHSLNHSRHVAALTKYQHLKIVHWHRAPLPLHTLCTNT